MTSNDGMWVISGNAEEESCSFWVVEALDHMQEMSSLNTNIACDLVRCEQLMYISFKLAL